MTYTCVDVGVLYKRMLISRPFSRDWDRYRDRDYWEWSDGSLRSSGSWPAGEGIKSDKQLEDCHSIVRLTEEGPGDERSIFSQIRQWICHHSHLQTGDPGKLNSQTPPFNGKFNHHLLSDQSELLNDMVGCYLTEIIFLSKYFCFR